MAAVEIRALCKSYGSTVVVDGVDLRIEHGQLVCLLGPSGCGKTTTLRLLAGFLEPDGGEIVVGGRRLSSPGRVVPPERRNMSMIFQSYAVWPHMTVFDNVAYGLKLRGLARSTIQERVRGILDLVRMEQLADRYPGELSGGQQQRVALARALVVEPETLLLDEPLSNLDAHLREEMRFEIRRLHEQYKITTVYVTHDQSEAMVIADRIAVMNQGCIEQVGTGEEIYERPRTEFVARFIGQTNLLPGTLASEPGLVTLRGGVLRTADAQAASPGASVAVSIRPSDIAILPGVSGNGADTNVLKGKVLRAYYLGASRDYQVEVADAEGLCLRVVAPPDVTIGPGEAVTLRLPQERCRVLAR
jgi:iron(III) transport system ATP-binding protein